MKDSTFWNVTFARGSGFTGNQDVCVAGCGLGLGASASHTAKARCMGHVLAGPGRVVDLGIVLAFTRAPGGVGRDAPLDLRSGGQYLAELSVE